MPLRPVEYMMRVLDVAEGQFINDVLSDCLPQCQQLGTISQSQYRIHATSLTTTGFVAHLPLGPVWASFMDGPHDISVDQSLPLG